MQGIWIRHNVGSNSTPWRRPKSKKEVRETLEQRPEEVRFEGTSFDGRDYDGPAEDLPKHMAVHFVGPDPHTKRNFYGTASHAGGKWVVK